MNRLSLPICLSVSLSVCLSIYLSINQKRIWQQHIVCVSSETMCMAGETAWDSGTVECSEAGHISAPVRKALEKPLR